MEAALSSGSRSVMNCTVLGWLTSPAMIASFRPVTGSIRVPRNQGPMSTSSALMAAGLRPETTSPIQFQLVLTMAEMLAAVSCGSRALMKARVAGSLAMAAMLAVFRPGIRVPVIQPERPLIMLLTVAGVMLVTTELSQAHVGVDDGGHGGRVEQRQQGGDEVHGGRVVGDGRDVGGVQAGHAGCRSIQAVRPLIMLLTVAGVMWATTELSQAQSVLTMEAMEAALSSGSRSVMNCTVLGWLTSPAMIASFRPVAGSIRVPRNQGPMSTSSALMAAGLRPETTSPIQFQLVLTMAEMLAGVSCGSRALMKARVAGSLTMAAMLAVFRPGSRVPVIQPGSAR